MWLADLKPATSALPVLIDLMSHEITRVLFVMRHRLTEGDFMQGVY